MTKAELLTQRVAVRKGITDILALGDDVTLEQITEAEALKAKLDEIDTSIEKFNRILTFQENIKSDVTLPGYLDPSLNTKSLDDTFTIPAEARGYVSKNFSRDGSLDENQKAYMFGQWFKGNCLGQKSALDFCRERGLVTKTQVENENALGGFFVPSEFLTDYIRLVEKHGVARRLFNVVDMSRDTAMVPRRRTGLTTYFINEAGSFTASDMTIDQVTLVAKKLGVLNVQSNELFGDNVIAMADKVIEEIAQAFAEKEDDCAINGDGTSTYGGIFGIRPKLLAVDGTIANIKGLQVGTGNLYSELTVPDFASTIGRLPVYADNNPYWVVHSKFYFSVMVKLAQTSGGLTPGQLMQGEGVASMRFLGYPVMFCQKMPSTEANSQICALFGNYKQGAMFGNRNDLSLAVSNEYGFSTDTRAIRGIQRFDVNVHDVGDTTDAGPIVGLITAAS